MSRLADRERNAGFVKVDAAEFAVGVARASSGGVVVRGARASDDETTLKEFVEELDTTGKIVWRQTDLEEFQSSGAPEVASLAPIAALDSGGVSTGRLAGFIDLDQDGNAVIAGDFVTPPLRLLLPVVASHCRSRASFRRSPM